MDLLQSSNFQQLINQPSYSKQDLDTALMEKESNMPEIYFTPGANPIISSSNSPFVLQFKQTKESLLDLEVYKNFLDNAISRFRKSRTYKNYKYFLIQLGLNRCQIHGNITSEMATIEMHHNMLTIFDIAMIITSHIINTVPDGLTTMDLVKLLKIEHTNHHVQLVMLSLTDHQLYHNTEQLDIPPDMCFGNWFAFLKKYRYGISKDIAYKVLFYLKDFEDRDFGNNYDILEVRDEILRWAEYNERVEMVAPMDGQLIPYNLYISNQPPAYLGMPQIF